jgi:hypothetical protein
MQRKRELHSPLFTLRKKFHIFIGHAHESHDIVIIFAEGGKICYRLERFDRDGGTAIEAFARDE